MGSPMPKISWGCKKQIVIAETGCDSDETYFEGSSPRNANVKEIVPNNAITAIDLSHEHSQSLKLNSAINAKYTSLVGAQVNSSNSRSAKQEKMDSGSGCVRRLSWKEPIASYSQGSAQRLPKKFGHGDSVVPKLHELHEKLSRMNGKVTRSLLAGGRPLTYENAERMLRKAELCIEKLTTLAHGPQGQVRDTRLVANQIVKRLKKKMTEINREGSDFQHPTDSGADSTYNILPLKNVTQRFTADSFETQLSLSQTSLQNGQELIWNDDNQTQSQTQMTIKELPHKNTYFANQAQAIDQTQTHSRNNLQTQELGNSPSLLLPTKPNENAANQMKVTQANSSKPSFVAQVDSVATERYAQSQNGFETQSTLSPSLAMTDEQAQHLNHVETHSAMQVDSQTQQDADSFQASSDIYSSCNLQPEVGASKQGAGDVAALSSTGGEKTHESKDCNGTMVLSCVTGEMISVSGDYDEFRDGFDMDQGSFQESLSAGLETEARSSNAEDGGMRSSGRIVGNVAGNGDSQATISKEDFSQDFIEDTQPMDFKSIRTPKRRENQFVEAETAHSLLPKAVDKTTGLPLRDMGNIVKSKRRITKPTTSEDKIERLISEVIKNVNRLPSKSQPPNSKCFSQRDPIPIDVKSNDEAEILWESAEKQSQVRKNPFQGNSANVQDSSLMENDLPRSSFHNPSDSLQREQESNAPPNGDNGKPVCEKGSREIFPESLAAQNVRETGLSTASQRPAREVIVMSTTERLDDKQWRLLQALYERQKTLRESQKTGEMSSSLGDSLQSLGQMEHDGDEVSSSMNIKPSGSNFQAKVGNNSILLSPETLVGSQVATSNATENSDSTQLSTQMLLECSQDIDNTCTRSFGQKSLAENTNGGRSLTQAMLEDSQEMDIGTDLETSAERSPGSLTVKPLSQEVIATSQEDSTQSTVCFLEPSTRKDCERNFGNNEISTQDLLEDSQEMSSQLKKEIIAPSKMTGAKLTFTSQLVRNSFKVDRETQNPRFGEVSFPRFVAPQSVVLGVPLLKTLSPAPTEWLACRGGLSKNQASDKNKLPRRSSHQASQDFPRKSQASSQKGSISMETDSLPTFEATAKSGPQNLGQMSVLRPLPPNCEAISSSLAPTIRAGSQDSQNATHQLEFDFLRPQNPAKKGKKRPLPNECVSTQKSTAAMATSNSTSCFQRMPADKSESLTQLLVQDSQEWSYRDLERLNKPNSNISQTTNRPGTLVQGSGVQLMGHVSRSTGGIVNKAVGDRFLGKQINIQNVPGLTAIDVDITRKSPVKAAPNLEATNSKDSCKDKLTAKEVDVPGVSNLTTTAKQYCYFVATPMKEKTVLNSTASQQGSLGKVPNQGFKIFSIASHQNPNGKCSMAFPYSVQQQGRSNQPMYQQMLVGNQVENQRAVSVPLRQLQTQNQSQTTEQTVKTVQSTVGQAKITLPNHQQSTPTTKHADQYETFDTLILNMFDFKNVMRRRALTEGQSFVKVQNVTEAAKEAGKVPNPLMSRFSSSVLSELLSPKDLDPARQAEQDMILSLTHVRKQTAREFAPKTKEIAEFLRTPFSWDNVPADVPKDLEDSSDEDDIS